MHGGNRFFSASSLDNHCGIPRSQEEEMLNGRREDE